jgi:HSP20 family protein
MSESVLNDLYELTREMSRIFDTVPTRGLGKWPETNVYESPEAFVLVSKVPGVAKKDIDISIKDNTLTISGERKPPKREDAKSHLSERFFGAFERSYLLNQKSILMASGLSRKTDC